MVIIKAIPQPIGKELDVESYMVGKVFASSFQNINGSQFQVLQRGLWSF